MRMQGCLGAVLGLSILRMLMPGGLRSARERGRASATLRAVRRVGACMALCLAGALWAGVAPALAAHGLKHTFYAPSNLPEEEFEVVKALAVDHSNGDLYISTKGPREIKSKTRSPGTPVLRKLSINGETDTQLWAVNIPDSEHQSENHEIQQIAVDDYKNVNQGDVFVLTKGSSGYGPGYLYKYGPEGKLISTFASNLYKEVQNESYFPEDVAVDAAGDVFVSLGNRKRVEVLEFNADGEPINASGAPDAENIVIDSTEGILAEAIAVSESGNELYVAAALPRGGYATLEYSLNLGTYTKAFTSLPGGTAFAFTPTGNVVIDREGEISVNEPATVEPLESFGQLDRSHGVATFGSTVYASSYDYPELNAENGRVEVFEEEPAPEAPTTGSASVNGTSAVLHGTLNPGSRGRAGWYFAYGSNGSCKHGAKTPAQPEVEGQALEEAAEATGLEAFATYTYCMVAYNNNGPSYGPPATFTIGAVPPAVDGESASALTSHGATLHAQVNPEKQETRCLRFEYGLQAGEYTGSVPCAEESLGAGHGAAEASAALTKLTRKTTYHFRVVVANPSSPGGETDGPDQSFTTLPLLIGQQAEPLGPDAAKVSATLNGEGGRVVYYVEYGTSSGYGASTSPAVAPQAAEEATVDLDIEGLAPETAYHYRVVAEDQYGREYGPDATFATYPATVAGLPNGRVYELVSNFEDPSSEAFVPYPALLAPEAQTEAARSSYSPFRAAADGAAVTFIGSPDREGGSGNEVTQASGGNQYLAQRSAGGGWKLSDISPPGDLHAQYLGFTADLSSGVLEAAVEPPFVAAETLLSPPETGSHAVQAILYERSTGAEGLFRPLFPSVAAYRTSEKDLVNEYEGTSANGAYRLVNSTEDLLSGEGAIERQLAEQVKTEAKEGIARTDLYLLGEGAASLVNVLPNGEINPNATVAPTLSNAISADGSRVFWTSSKDAAQPQTVFVRENGTRTVQVSAGSATFWTASPGGKLAYYTEAGKLWRFDLESEERTQLAGGEEGVRGVIATNEAGEEGAYLYFVATEKLTAEANAAGREPVAGEDNLYLQEPETEGGGTRTAFIGTLSGQNAPDWSAGLNGRTANITPDGRGLVFASRRNLTSGSYPDEGAEEVYVYDAGDGSLFCASCRPQASGGDLPGADVLAKGVPDSTYVPRWISEDGDEVFFDSSAQLVPQDIAGLQQVYEWQRDGSGSCAEAAGCVYMLSSGIEAEADFIDASASGSDVFFVTRQRLVPEDGDENVDVYDARVGGVLPVSPPACTGTGCQGAAAPPPTFATPPSVTFEGVGNFLPPRPVGKPQKPKPCAKGRVRRHGRCVRRKRKRVGRQKAGKRRAGGTASGAATRRGR